VSEQFYPSADGWSVRVYHDADKLNDKALTERLCNLTCKFGHLEFCDMSRLPEPAMKYNKKGFFFSVYSEIYLNMSYTGYL
jgi:hypothetical protein